MRTPPCSRLWTTASSGKVVSLMPHAIGPTGCAQWPPDVGGRVPYCTFWPDWTCGLPSSGNCWPMTSFVGSYFLSLMLTGGVPGANTPSWYSAKTIAAAAAMTPTPIHMPPIRPRRGAGPCEREGRSRRSCSRRSRRVTTLLIPDQRTGWLCSPHVRSRALRAFTDRRAAHRQRAHEPLQPSLRAAEQRDAHPSDRGHRSRAIRPTGAREHLRRLALGRDPLAGGTSRRRAARPVRAVRTPPALSASCDRDDRDGRGLPLLLQPRAPRADARRASGAQGDHALRPPLPTHRSEGGGRPREPRAEHRAPQGAGRAIRRDRAPRARARRVDASDARRSGAVEVGRIPHLPP